MTLPTTLPELYQLRTLTCSESIKAGAIMRAQALTMANTLVRGLTVAKSTIQTYAEAVEYHTKTHTAWQEVEAAIKEAIHLRNPAKVA